MRALLIGKEPPLAYEFVQQPPYDAVVIGSLGLAQALRFSEERALMALAEGKPVILYTPGLPQVTKNRALSASLAASRRQMKNWGILFTDGAQKKLVTAQEAREMKSRGIRPAPGAVLTPLAREVLESS